MCKVLAALTKLGVVTYFFTPQQKKKFKKNIREYT
jgi:response regulator of citrate/malate metabolism